MDMVKWSVRRDTLDDKLRDFLEWMRAVKIATVHHVCVYLFVGDSLSCISATFPALVMLKVETPFTCWPQVLHTPVFLSKVEVETWVESVCMCVTGTLTKGDKSGYTHVKCWLHVMHMTFSIELAPEALPHKYSHYKTVRYFYGISNLLCFIFSFSSFVLLSFLPEHLAFSHEITYRFYPLTLIMHLS